MLGQAEAVLRHCGRPQAAHFLRLAFDTENGESLSHSPTEEESPVISRSSLRGWCPLWSARQQTCHGCACECRTGGESELEPAPPAARAQAGMSSRITRRSSLAASTTSLSH
jgi:hypothetical protein